jgi:Phasin protein
MRMTVPLPRALELAGGETDGTAQQASRNLSAIMQVSQALNEGVRKVSDEWFKFARARIERAFEHVDKAMRSELRKSWLWSRPKRCATIWKACCNRRSASSSCRSKQRKKHRGSRRSEWAERPEPSGHSLVQPDLRAARKPPFVFPHPFAVNAGRSRSPPPSSMSLLSDTLNRDDAEAGVLSANVLHICGSLSPRMT